MAAPYRVVSPLPTAAGLEKFLAEDAAGVKAWVFQAADRTPGTDDRMLAAAARCTRSIPDLVQVLDSGRDGAARAWVATGPLEGSSLAQLLAGGEPLDTATMVRACARLAEVLEAVAPLGLLPALSPDLVWLAGVNVQLLGFSPASAPQTLREQTRALGSLLDAAVPVGGRRDDVAAVVRRCLDDRPESFARP
ncbi:MAG: hypothetical protein H6Q89_5319, partial [Myxococcaceae bacterium]|nr:hypothetical protein [Myxococcaceae bacterium]